ncbi:hypothetical protein I552_5696 [Mycobacterium xenopi 3993]|nr:hypothetical protein I552_5696 [Mycobacterium xenopi 3993]
MAWRPQARRSRAQRVATRTGGDEPFQASRIRRSADSAA